MRLLPREEKFFDLFNKQVALVKSAVQLLTSTVKSGSPSRKEVADQLVGLENDSDRILNEIFDRLNQTFITPIDPEDIHALTSLVDHVIDNIEDAAHRLWAYEITDVPQDMKELAGVVEESVLALEKAFHSIEKREAVSLHCKEINRLEEKADHLERKAVAELFRHEKDPIRVMKYREIYEALESAADACEDVADRLQNVVVKNS
jgi:predicted phosphate transport protein (TIGR00153 family)